MPTVLTASTSPIATRSEAGEARDLPPMTRLRSGHGSSPSLRTQGHCTAGEGVKPLPDSLTVLQDVACILKPVRVSERLAGGQEDVEDGHTVLVCGGAAGALPTPGGGPLGQGFKGPGRLAVDIERAVGPVFSAPPGSRT